MFKMVSFYTYFKKEDNLFHPCEAERVTIHKPMFYHSIVCQNSQSADFSEVVRTISFEVATCHWVRGLVIGR